MEAISPSLMTIVLLIAAAFVAGYIDTLVGGGGLITIPALLLAGVPPIYALGTNKLQAVAGSGTATVAVLSRSEIRFRDVRGLMSIACIASLTGAVSVQFFDASVLNFVIPLVISLIATYFIFAPVQSLQETTPKISSNRYALTAIPCVGIYDGMFGPGTGSFFVWAGVSLRGQSIVRATMLAKPLNFATNLAALGVFAAFGHVFWTLGALMMLGQALGARLGTRALMRIEPGLLRLMVIAICFIMLIVWGVRSISDVA